METKPNYLDSNRFCIIKITATCEFYYQFEVLAGTYKPNKYYMFLPIGHIMYFTDNNTFFYNGSLFDIGDIKIIHVAVHDMYDERIKLWIEGVKLLDKYLNDTNNT